MAVFVSLATCQVNRRQADVAQAQVSPHIRVATELIYNTAKDRYTDQVVKIFNDGFPLKQFEYKKISFYEVTRMHGSYIQKAYFPIIYLVGTSSTNNSTGLIVTYYQKNNNEHASRIEREISKFSDLSKGISYDVRLQNLFIISYTDALGNTKRRHFLVGSTHKSIEISEHEAGLLIGHYEKKNLKDIEEISGKMLIEQFPPHKGH